MSKLEFPKGFFWGAATASHQVEGGTHNDWTEWELANADRLMANATKRSWPDFILQNHPNPLQKENYISGVACDHYHRFKDDFDIAKSLGHNAHRFSIEWSRIEPREGEFDERELSHYHEMIYALRERGIEPFVTVWHYTLPLWLAKSGGMSHPKFIEYFARYAEKLAEAFKDDVRFWITINEPEVFVNSRPPTKRNKTLFLFSMNRLARAHIAARNAIKKVSPKAEVGASMCIAHFESAGGLINNILKSLIDRFGNFYFLNRIRRATDFIGLNYYFRNRIDHGFNKNPNLRKNDFGWEIFPEGIYHCLKELCQYHLPIYITENGLADARDEQRAWFITETTKNIHRAISDGVDVRGYFHWSFMDNFEWDSGFWPRFGLIQIDYATQKRTPRPSAYLYKKICEENAVSLEE